MRAGYRILVTTGLFLAMAVTAMAQAVVRPADTARHVRQAVVRPKAQGPKAVKHELSGGFRLNSDGWSGYMDYGKVKAKNPRTADMFYNVRLWQLEFTEKKSPRQEKITVDDGNGSSSTYFYGKINNFYAFKLGYGVRSLLAGKPDPGAVSIHWVNVVGVSLGMLKPYYINVISDPSAIKYSDGTKSDFFNQNIITGGAGFTKGLSEMTFIPGAHLKSALHFDFAANRTNIIGAEIGFNIEYYSSKIAIMANDDAKPYFTDLFLAVQFGKRW